MNYMKHLKANWKVAFHSFNDFLEHFIHGLLPCIKWEHKQPAILPNKTIFPKYINHGGLNDSRKINHCSTQATFFKRKGENTIMKEAESLFGTMREASYEEQASVHKYINSISKETGIDFVERQSEN